MNLLEYNFKIYHRFFFKFLHLYQLIFIYCNIFNNNLKNIKSLILPLVLINASYKFIRIINNKFIYYAFIQIKIISIIF